MPRVTHVKKAQQRYKTVPVLDEYGNPAITAVLRKDGTPKTTKKGRPVTRRQTVADKSQPLDPETCGKCGTTIEVGQPYKWTQVKRTYGGIRMVRCATCPGWRASELTGSAALGTLYAAQEDADDAMAQWDEEDYSYLVDLLQALAEGVREAGEVYRESSQNMEDGFGHETERSAELAEWADDLDGQADEIESAADEIDNLGEFEFSGEDEVFEFDPEDIDHGEDAETAEERQKEAWEEDRETNRESERDEWVESIRSLAEDAIGNVQAPG